MHISTGVYVIYFLFYINGRLTLKESVFMVLLRFLFVSLLGLFLWKTPGACFLNDLCHLGSHLVAAR